MARFSQMEMELKICLQYSLFLFKRKSLAQVVSPPCHCLGTRWSSNQLKYSETNNAPEKTEQLDEGNLNDYMEQSYLEGAATLFVLTWEKKWNLILVKPFILSSSRQQVNHYPNVYLMAWCFSQWFLESLLKVSTLFCML